VTSFSAGHARTPTLVRPSTGPLRTILASAAAVAAYAAVGFGVTLAAVVTLPAAVGYTSLTVLSGSMTPVLRTGDVVVAKKIAPTAARPGDVVTFRDPDDASKLITHRIVTMRVLDGHSRFVTRGDANTGVERWTVRNGGTIARVDLRVPKLGYMTNLVGSRFGRFGFLVLPALLLGLLELRRIWRPRHAQG
jgi:signal peptidase I